MPIDRDSSYCFKVLTVKFYLAKISAKFDDIRGNGSYTKADQFWRVLSRDPLKFSPHVESQIRAFSRATSFLLSLRRMEKLLVFPGRQ